jgi:DNA-binding XRE family transcriptional regulator
MSTKVIEYKNTQFESSGSKMKIIVKVTELNELRIQKGFSKRELAKVAEVSQTAVVQICKGNRNPSPFTAKKIVDALKVNFDDVFTIAKEGD